MKTFKDTADRMWTVQINVDAVKRVRDALGINLTKAVDDGFKLLAEIVEDPIRLVDVLFVLCQEQAEKQGVTDVDFGRSMSGDAIMQAAEAFIEALTGFFPNARSRAMLTALLGKGRKVRDLMMDKAELQIKALDPKKLASTLKVSSGISRASAASTPVP
jgi:hypothetical protein